MLSKVVKLILYTLQRDVGTVSTLTAQLASEISERMGREATDDEVAALRVPKLNTMPSVH
jgi:hypothetical protein